MRKTSVSVVMRMVSFGTTVILILLAILAAMQPFVPAGLHDPEPVGPYLNGVFPSQTPGNGTGNWEIVEAYPNLTFADPMSMIELPDRSGFYVSGKQGFVWLISKDSTTNAKTTVLDISARVHTDGDAGLINMILHPDFGKAGSPNRRYAYIIYRYHPDGDIIGGCVEQAYTRLSRFTKPDGQQSFDPNSEMVLVQQYDPHCWHTGGTMFFDNEGYFYFAFGDTGGANDPYNSSQQIDSTFFGGLHRIDLDMNPARSHPIRRQPQDPPSNMDESSYSQGYYVPNDNPWVNPDGSVLEEFFALGFRSPHRGDYDEVNGDIWIGDVGEGTIEEIDLVRKGDNLQWPFREGSIAGPKAAPPIIIGTSKGPVYEYSHATGNAIIGGFIYRGDLFNAALDGKFIFGDHGTRNVWSLNPNTQEVDFLATVPVGGVGSKNGISSFASDSVGNIFILKLFGTDLDGGVIYKLQPTVSIPDPPALLSQTGAFTNLSTLTPATGLLPYRVNSPLWSDAALKSRWIALPNDGAHDTPGEQITFSENDPWQFPPGTVFIKHFELETDNRDPAITARVETRFIIIREDGGSYGVTYKWRPDGSDADLLPGSDTMTFNIIQTDATVRPQVWTYPSRTDCQTCHNENAGWVLGINTWQLNGDYTYPNQVTDNQLNTWHTLGMFSNPFQTNEIPQFLQSVAIDSQQVDLTTRVRSYLDANCAHCHRPNGVNGAFDARYSTPLSSQYLVNTPGISVNTPPGHVIVKPNRPLESELWIRDEALGSTAMPPVGKGIVDTAYITVLTDWINSLVDSTCYIDFLSDLNFAVDSINGWGPVEKDRSNGSSAAGDGSTLTINGVTYQKGLGSHAYAEFVYDLNGGYARFLTSIGVDDATCSAADVQFHIHLDDSPVYTSPVMTQADDAIDLDIDVTGFQQLKLIVTDPGNDLTCDHANWGNARLIKICDDGDPCTRNDAFGVDCNCAGTLIDDNGDGICDSLNFRVAVRMHLEGAMTGTLPGEAHLMRDDLRQLGYLPLESPYPDQVSCTPNTLNIAGDQAVVDWVWIELRDPANPETVLEAKSGLLQRDGDVVSPKGTAPLTFSIGAGAYIVAVQHRNHLGVMTDQAFTFSKEVVNQLDFSNGSLALQGSNPTILVQGQQCLWSGDADGSGVVDAGDRSDTWNSRNQQGYDPTDCNLDGVTDAGDRSTTWNRRNLISNIPK